MSANLTEGIVRWWDELGNLARGFRSAALTGIGRMGERLTLAYERDRTGQEPLWQSIESSFSGYDVLSVVSATDSTPMPIEVKASELRLKDACFYVSANEWESAQQARAHTFHVWRVGEQPQLAIIGVEQLAPHVSANKGDGLWQSLKVPYFSFRSLFMHVPTKP